MTDRDKYLNGLFDNHHLVVSARNWFPPCKLGNTGSVIAEGEGPFKVGDIERVIADGEGPFFSVTGIVAFFRVHVPASDIFFIQREREQTIYEAIQSTALETALNGEPYSLIPGIPKGDWRQYPFDSLNIGVRVSLVPSGEDSPIHGELLFRVVPSPKGYFVKEGGIRGFYLPSQQFPQQM